LLASGAGRSINEKDIYGSTALLGSTSSRGAVDLVTCLLAAGASVHDKDNQGRTALILASCGDCPKLVSALLTAADAGETINEKDKSYQRMTALMYASKRGNIEIVSSLIKAGASLDEKDRDDWTALMYASTERRDSVVSALIKAGASINEKSKQGLTALMLVANHGLTEGVSVLLAAGAFITEEDVKNNQSSFNPWGSDIVALINLALEKFKKETVATDPLRTSYFTILTSDLTENIARFKKDNPGKTVKT
jgi:ankyrin repeat protein